MKIQSMVFAVCIFGFLYTGCTKSKVPVPVKDKIPVPTSVTDYRDSFIGNYSCFKLCTYWDMNQQQTDTNFIGYTNIIVSKHPSLNASIIVQNDTVPIDSSGTYSSGFYSIPGYKFYSIIFKNDSININTFVGGLGGGTTCKTKGKK